MQPEAAQTPPVMETLFQDHCYWWNLAIAI